MEYLKWTRVLPSPQVERWCLIPLCLKGGIFTSPVFMALSVGFCLVAGTVAVASVGLVSVAACLPVIAMVSLTVLAIILQARGAIGPPMAFAER